MKGEGSMDNNALFKAYTQWCKKNDKDPLSEASMIEFKDELEAERAKKIVESRTEEREEKVAKQQEIFKMICEYVGIKAKYDEEIMFDGLDSMFRAVTLATVICNRDKEVSEIADKILG